MTTPYTLTGLHARRPIEVRLDKIGFRPVTEKIELGPGETQSRLFKLVEDNGTVILDGLPPQATIYVDDKQVEARGPLVLSLGEHRLRAETAAARRLVAKRHRHAREADHPGAGTKEGRENTMSYSRYEPLGPAPGASPGARPRGTGRHCWLVLPCSDWRSPRR